MILLVFLWKLEGICINVSRNTTIVDDFQIWSFSWTDLIHLLHFRLEKVLNPFLGGGGKFIFAIFESEGRILLPPPPHLSPVKFLITESQIYQQTIH